MKATVIAVTYTGAGFRGFEDDEDGVTVKFDIEGDEDAIVDYLRENFSYGNDEPVMTLKELAEMYATSSEPIFDGCGGVLSVTVDGKAVIDNTKFCEPEDLHPREVGTVKLDECEKVYNHILTML